MSNDMPHALPNTAAELDAAVAHLSYEDARAELMQIVGTLEQGNIPLEQSLALWERGEALARRCEAWLDGARKRLDAARAVSDSTQHTLPNQQSLPNERSKERESEGQE